MSFKDHWSRLTHDEKLASVLQGAGYGMIYAALALQFGWHGALAAFGYVLTHAQVRR